MRIAIAVIAATLAAAAPIAAQQPGNVNNSRNFRAPMGWLGMGIECEDCAISYGFRPMARFRNPPAVLTVDVDGPAHRAGLRRGDSLLTINGMSLTTPEGGRAFAGIEPGQRVQLTVRRDGRDRQVRLVAVARPDADPEELAAYNNYRRGRDSIQGVYRESMAEAMRAASVEMRALEQYMRAAELDRSVLDSSRKHLSVIDSALREMRSAERRLSVAYPRAGGYAYAAPMPPVPPVPPVAAVPPTAVAPAVAGSWAWSASSAPLRYSGRLGDLVYVEARAPGAVNVNEIGDSAIVVTAGETVVRITRRPMEAPVATPAPAAEPSPAPAAAPRPARPARPRD